MKVAATIFVVLVALEHLWILVLEMFLWQHPMGLRAFNLTPEYASVTATLAKNQGLYNGFLAAGLIWSFFLKDIASQTNVRYFFLTCVVIAGIYGAVTTLPKIFFVQSLPAIIGIIFVRLSKR